MCLSFWHVFFFPYLIQLTNSSLLHCFGDFPGQNTEEANVNIFACCKCLYSWKGCCMCPRGEIQMGCSSENRRERGRKSPTAGRKCVRGVKVLRRHGYLVLSLETFQKWIPQQIVVSCTHVGLPGSPQHGSNRSLLPAAVM